MGGSFLLLRKFITSLLPPACNSWVSAWVSIAPLPVAQTSQWSWRNFGHVGAFGVFRSFFHMEISDMNEMSSCQVLKPTFHPIFWDIKWQLPPILPWMLPWLLTRNGAVTFGTEEMNLLPASDIYLDVWEPLATTRSYSVGGQLVTSFIITGDLEQNDTLFEPEIWHIYIDTSASTADSFLATMVLKDWYKTSGKFPEFLFHNFFVLYVFMFVQFVWTLFDAYELWIIMRFLRFAICW